jgi:hypothetical protein
MQSLDAIREEAMDKAKKLRAILEGQADREQPVTITTAALGDPKLEAFTDSKIKAL